MSAFLKLDRCRTCTQEFAWEWTPPITLNGRVLAGTGVWRTILVDEQCASCIAAAEKSRTSALALSRLRERFIRIVGGSKPYHEFTFSRFAPSPPNQLALDAARAFDSVRENLYLWGSCGVGKTHLGVAILRRGFSRGASAAMTTPGQLVRRLRMRSPEDEQRIIDELVRVDLLLVDDLSASDSNFFRQVLQEVVDARHFAERGGLIVTSVRSVDELARDASDPSLASRLAGMCRIIRLSGPDHRRRALNSSRTDS